MVGKCVRRYRVVGEGREMQNMVGKGVLEGSGQLWQA